MFAEFVQEQTLLFVALAVVIAMLAYSYLGDRLSGYKSVNTDEATRLFNDDAFLLDVRTAAEYKDGFIGTAINLPVTDLAANMNKLPKDKEQPLLIYCLTGARSGKAAGILTKAGYTQVSNLAGGINAWKSAGLAVATPKAKRNRKK
jgi:rhodanese-related sulfurtransferase